MMSKKGLITLGLRDSSALKNLSPGYNMTSDTLKQRALPPNEDRQSYCCPHPELCLGRLQISP